MTRKVYSQMDDVVWLLAHPEFKERPATIDEFINSPRYLNLKGKVRPGVQEALEDIFGDDVTERIAQYERAMFTGAIGVGKTTLCSIALPYMAHWVLCLKDPQGYYDLLPGSRIAFMQMSTSEDQARQVVYGDIKARIDTCKWFMEKYPYDPKYTKSLRFAKDIWILPGDSAETTFEGYNILGGIVDEMDSHKLTKEKDYAEIGYDTIENRVSSRFVDNSPGSLGGHRGLTIVVGQMKKANGFAHKKYVEMLDDPRAKVIRMTIWESFGWDKYLKPDGTRDSFWYDIRRKRIMQDWVGQNVDSPDLIEIPNNYKQPFLTNPEKALRDLAGIPPEAADPFISLTYKLEEAKERWHERFGPLVPVSDSCTQPVIADWVGTPEYTDSRKRVAHIDIAYSAEGDAAAIAIGHVDHLHETADGEMMPYIVIDMLYRIRAGAGTEIMIADLRNIIYMLKVRGMRIDKVTLDGFQSTDTMQQLRKKKFRVDYVSLDRSKLGYEDLREAVYQDRIEWPEYMTYRNPGGTERVEILYQELIGLSDTGLKIDHAKDGSKDLADAVAGVVTTLMGDATYRKGIYSPSAQGSAQIRMSPQEALEKLLGGFTRTTESGGASPAGMPDMSSLLRPREIEIPERLKPR